MHVLNIDFLVESFESFDFGNDSISESHERSTGEQAYFESNMTTRKFNDDPFPPEYDTTGPDTVPNSVEVQPVPITNVLGKELDAIKYQNGAVDDVDLSIANPDTPSITNVTDIGQDSTIDAPFVLDSHINQSIEDRVAEIEFDEDPRLEMEDTNSRAHTDTDCTKDICLDTPFSLYDELEEQGGSTPVDFTEFDQEPHDEVFNNTINDNYSFISDSETPQIKRQLDTIIETPNTQRVSDLFSPGSFFASRSGNLGGDFARPCWYTPQMDEKGRFLDPIGPTPSERVEKYGRTPGGRRLVREPLYSDSTIRSKVIKNIDGDSFGEATDTFQGISTVEVIDSVFFC